MVSEQIKMELGGVRIVMDGFYLTGYRLESIIHAIDGS